MKKRPCVNGHDLPRNERGDCPECSRLRHKRYYERNRKKRCADAVQYWLKQKAGEKPMLDRKAASKKYYENHRAEHKTLMQDWRARSPGYDTERMRIWRARKADEARRILGKMRFA